MNIYRHDVDVEFEDVDSYGIVHHSKLINYLERARLHFFDSMGFNPGRLPYNFIIYKVDCRFIRPALLLDRLVVELTDIALSGFHVTVTQRILRNNEPIVKAKIVHALISGKNGEVVPVPPEFQKKLIMGIA